MSVVEQAHFQKGNRVIIGHNSFVFEMKKIKIIFQGGFGLYNFNVLLEAGGVVYFLFELLIRNKGFLD